MRHLASVHRIIDLQPIPGAESIEVAQALGWHVVVKKGEFQPGNLAVYSPPSKPLLRRLRVLTDMRQRGKWWAMWG